MKKLLILAALTLGAHAAHAGFYTGNNLKTWSEATERIYQGRTREGDYTDYAKIHGYVTGVSDALDGYVICVTAGVTVKQLLAITAKYLNDHPSDWNSEASLLVASSLKPVFPCKQSQ